MHPHRSGPLLGGCQQFVRTLTDAYLGFVFALLYTTLLPVAPFMNLLMPPMLCW